MAIRLCPFDIGCEPSPSVPAETLVQDGWKTYLLFFAVSKTADESGHLKDLGVAVLDCKDCRLSKFGYPNDEGVSEHPLYAYGMADAQSSVLEVIESPWKNEIMKWYHPTGGSLRHFVITLMEATFECIASALEVERFCKTFDEAFAHVIQEFDKN
jgi:hypothetical protein